MLRAFGCIAMWCLASGIAWSDDPLWLRVCNFTVTPSTGPVAHVEVRNQQTTPFRGRLRAEFPTGWKVTPAEHVLELKPGETRKLPFAIEKATDNADNRYKVKLRVQGEGVAMNAEQVTLCASAPYFKPTIDGDFREWADSLPLTLVVAGKQTVARSYWNSKQFCLAVEVEEDALIGWSADQNERAFDAVQFSLAQVDATETDHYEFLVAANPAAGASAAICCALRKPGDDAATIAQIRPLGGLVMENALAAVVRKDKVTRCEIAIPTRFMPDLKPTAGREIRFGLLVHDPGATGIRDFGALMNRWPTDRTPQGWSSWQGVRWGKTPPWNGLGEFGFCSSIH